MGFKPLQRAKTSDRCPLFVAETDFEQRIDSANGTIVASDLSEIPKPPVAGSLIRRIRLADEQGRAGKKGMLPSIGRKIKEQLGDVVDKIRGERSECDSHKGLYEQHSW